MAENSGPDKYAPPHRRTSEKLTNLDPVMASAVEGEIREFVRRDVSLLQRQRSEGDVTNGPVAENLNSMIQSIAGDSMEEIDRVIRELEVVREMLRKEGERVSREVGGYASLNHAAATAMKVIADSIKHWKDTPNKPSPKA